MQLSASECTTSPFSNTPPYEELWSSGPEETSIFEQSTFPRKNTDFKSDSDATQSEIGHTQPSYNPVKPKTLKAINDEFLYILSFNIEGVTSNFSYLELLANRADILLLQEHWLYGHETNIICDLLPDFNCHIKCFNDGIHDDVTHRKRGNAGVAICDNK